MHTITCDVCRKKMDNPVTGVNFHYYPKYGICEPCNDSLQDQVKTQVRSRDPFSREWYTKYINDSLDKAVQKGKI